MDEHEPEPVHVVVVGQRLGDDQCFEESDPLAHRLLDHNPVLVLVPVSVSELISVVDDPSQVHQGQKKKKTTHQQKSHCETDQNYYYQADHDDQYVAAAVDICSLCFPLCSDR